MTWPAGTSVRQNVLANLLTAANAIITPTYKTGVVFAGFVGNQVFTVPGYPAVLFSTPSLTSNDDVHAIVRCRMRVPVTLVLEQSGEELFDIGDFVEDFRVAVLADHTRGGFARTTRITEDNLSPLEVPEPFVVADLSVEIDYAHLYLDPSSPA